MLELYHSINSVCAQKVRIALAEKGLHAKEHFLTLRGDQFDPSYMRLNPNAVVPTLVHDGHAISSRPSFSIISMMRFPRSRSCRRRH